MAESAALPEPVYLPSNEPYLGRQSVLQFDQTIVACMEANAIASAYSYQAELSDLQSAACQVIPQGINLALSIRELVQQGYLFSALVLMRPLIERAAIMSYLTEYPDEVAKWRKGWQRDKKGKTGRPSLARMLQAMSGKPDTETPERLCTTFGHIVHGDPTGAQWNVVRLSNGGLGYSVGKVVNDPELCDFICLQACCYLVTLGSLMRTPFPLSASEGS